MAIEPKKMEAWLAGNKKGEGEDKKPNPKKGSPPGQNADDHEDEEETGEEGDEEEEESDEEEEAEGDLEERYPTLFQALEDFGDVVEEAGDVLETPDLDEDELEDDKHDLLMQAIEELPKPVTKALKKEGKNIDRETANEIADALEVGEHIQDPDHFAGFLYHIAKNA